MSLDPEIYDLSDYSSWKQSLDNEGYAVIKNILTESEKQESYNLFMKDWLTVSPNFNFSNKDTWGIANTPMIYNKGLAVFNGFGQSDFMWSLRLNSNIQNIFKQIHNTEELVVSLDGFSVFLSYKQKSPSWLHIDQNPNNMIYSIQGAYNFYSVGVDDAGFQVVPRSHLEYTPDVKHSKNWIPCPDKELHLKAVKLLIPENCFTLWNSRLIHANVGMSKKKVEFNRLTAYITYLPKLVRPNNILEKRLNAYYNSETTSHWANKCEIKRYPWGFKTNYEKRGFGNIRSQKTDGKCPVERLNLI